MIDRFFRTRIPRVGSGLARAAAVASAAMLATTLGSRASAATNAGSLTVLVPPGTSAADQPLTAGGSATAFALAPPAGAACTGDSATGGYRVQSYIVPASVDPGTLTFDSSGPIPTGTGATLRLPLFGSVTTSPFVDATTAVATTPGAGGLLTGLPPFSFAAFGSDGPTLVPAGTYNLGFACTLGTASATQLDKFWNVQLTFVVDPTDVPSGIRWTVVAPAPPSTPASTDTTATTTLQPTGAITSSTTSSTTSTTSTTSTASTPFTTTTHATVRSSTPVQSVAGAATSVGSSGTPTLAKSGSSRRTFLLWVVILLMLGLIAALLGRRLRAADRKR